MRDKKALLANMTGNLEEYYGQFIEMVRQAIAEYFPREPGDEYVARVASQPALYPRDLETIRETMMRPTQEYLERGGKMLRPILAALTLEAYGADPRDFAPFLAAIEVMEDSSIMMDDYIDGSLMRRGGPCAHVRHGYALANISSCTAFIAAHCLFYNNEMNLPPEKALRLENALAWEHLQMSFGQIEELYWTESNVNDVDIDKYFQETIARCAFLTFRGPLRYAAILADAPEEDIPVLERIGEYLLIGYHIKGDTLDLSPDSPEWGKVAGEDITTGRRTLLMNYVLQHATPEDRATLVGILNSRTRDESVKRIAYELIRKYGAVDYIRGLAREYHKLTLEQIGRLHVSARYQKLFESFSEFSMLKRAT